MKNFYLFLILIVFIAFQSKSQTVIYSEDFEEKMLPDGWSQTTKSTDGGWKFCYASQTTTTRFPVADHTAFAITNESTCHCNKTDDRLITKSFDLSSYTSLNLSFDTYFVGGYWGDTTEVAKVYASKDGGATWQTLYTFQPSGDWYFNVVDITALTGKSDVRFAFVYNDDGGWIFGAGIDNVKIYIPLGIDVSATSIDMFDCYRQGDRTITGKIRNMGAAKINSMTINYQVDNGSTVSQDLTGLNISTGAYYTYTFSKAWIANSIGEQTVKVWATNINGGNDENAANDIISKIVNIFQAGKPVLVEYFTNASCYYCGKYVPGLEKTLNSASDFIIGLSYHANFPGTDPMYTNDNKNDYSVRGTLYKVDGVPISFTNGVNDNELMYYDNECGLSDNTTKETSIEITNPDLNLSTKTGTITFSADIEAVKDLTGNYKYFMAVIEKSVVFAKAPGTNGIKNFDWVMKKMIPNGNGTALPATMNTGYTQTISGQWTLSGTIYDQSKLAVVFFIQNMTTKEVLYAALAQQPVGINDLNNDNNNELEIFPNPFKNETYISFNLPKSEKVSLSLVNMLGQQLDFIDLETLSQGINQYNYKNTNLSPGIYFIDLKIGNEVSRKKVIIN